jgi:integrase/recombinase XerD
LLLLLLHTGLRCAEAAALKIEDFGIDRGQHMIWVSGKGNKRRQTLCDAAVFAALQTYRTAVQYVWSPVFVALKKNGNVRTQYGSVVPLAPPFIERIVAKRSQPLVDRGVLVRPLTPHDLRTTFATLAFEDGASLQSVQAAMGHAKPETTERYQRRTERLAYQAVLSIAWDRDEEGSASLAPSSGGMQM